MFRENPAKESLASFLSLTLTVNPLTLSDLPGRVELNSGGLSDIPGLVENLGERIPRGSPIAVNSRRGETTPLPRLTDSFRETGQPEIETVTKDPFASLTTPQLLSLFPVPQSIPSGQRPQTSPSISVRPPAAPSDRPLTSVLTPLSQSHSAAIPLKTLESWIQFGEVQSAWLERRKAAKMNWLQRLGASIQHNLHRDPANELARRAIIRIQSTPEGREVLGQLQDEYSRAGRKLIIAPADFRGSAIIRNNGVETVIGIRGQANPVEGIYLFNRKLLDFRDRDTTMEYLCGNLAHELRHLVSRAEVDRLSGRAGAAFSHAFIDEQRARLTGYLVAARLNNGKPTDYSDEARSWARDPKAFWEELKSWSVYAHNLDMDEMRDPIRSFTQRVTMLRNAIKENEANIAIHLPRIGSQLDVLEQREGLKGRLRAVRTIYENLLANEPGERAANTQMLYLITELRRTLSSPGGENRLKSFQSAPTDPGFRLLQRGLERDERELRALIKAKHLPRFTPKHGQLSWDEFKERVRQSQRENPQYWAEHRARFFSGGR